MSVSDGELLSLVPSLTLTDSTGTSDYRFCPYYHPGPSDSSIVYNPILLLSTIQSCYRFIDRHYFI